jgi:hypothetical protein
MGKIVIFIGFVLLFSLIGLGVWWLGCKIYLSVRRDNDHYEIEKEGYDKIKSEIRKINKNQEFR